MDNKKMDNKQFFLHAIGITQSHLSFSTVQTWINYESGPEEQCNYPPNVQLTI